MSTDIAQHAPNLWGALGCSVGYAGALFTTLDVLGDHIELRSTSPVVGLGGRLKSVGKLSGAGITVVSAGSVLALDSNWFALGTLSLFFAIVVALSWVVARRVDRSAARSLDRASSPVPRRTLAAPHDGGFAEHVR